MGRDENHGKAAGEEGPQEWEAGQDYVTYLALQKADVEDRNNNFSSLYLVFSLTHCNLTSCLGIYCDWTNAITSFRILVRRCEEWSLELSGVQLCPGHDSPQKVNI